MSAQNLEQLIKITRDLSQKEKVDLAKHLVSGSEMQVAYKEHFLSRLEMVVDRSLVLSVFFYMPLLSLLVVIMFGIDIVHISTNVGLSYLLKVYVLLACPVIILFERKKLWIRACAAILLSVYLFRAFN